VIGTRHWRQRLTIVTIAAVTVAIGLLPMPGEYYALLRIFLCGVAVYFLVQPAGVPDAAKWVLVALAILHNPIAPLELGSDSLAVVNIGTVIVFWLINRRLQRGR
jgi:hypothetical protein